MIRSTVKESLPADFSYDEVTDISSSLSDQKDTMEEHSPKADDSRMRQMDSIPDTIAEELTPTTPVHDEDAEKIEEPTEVTEIGEDESFAQPPHLVQGPKPLTETELESSAGFAEETEKADHAPHQLPQIATGDDDDEEAEDEQDNGPEGSYDPADYTNLNVSSEVKELFSFISMYTPQNIELEHRLRPYIPDYIPAVGDIDAFIKIQRPDNENSSLGLTVLDEPSAKQSDATVLDLQLRALARHSTARSVVVKRVDNAEKNTKVVEKWIKDISDLHRAKPPPTVHYSKRLPQIDSLMQEWPEEIEELLKEVQLPSGALQVPLPQYVDIICAILDIPVYKSRIQSLHVLFTLYSVFKNSAHFKQLAQDNILDNEMKNTPDRLVL